MLLSIIVHLIQLFIKLLIKLHWAFIKLIWILFLYLKSTVLLVRPLIIVSNLIVDLLLILVELSMLILNVWILKAFTVIIYFRHWHAWLIKLLLLPRLRLKVLLLNCMESILSFILCRLMIKLIGEIWWWIVHST